MPYDQGKTAMALARYDGRAFAHYRKAVYERQNGQDIFKYTSPSGRKYLIDLSDPDNPICDCPECLGNMHLMQAVVEGKKVWRNPGVTCKHIRNCLQLVGTVDLFAEIQALPDDLRAVAERAYRSELARLSQGGS